MTVTRKEALKVKCPECGADKNQPCKGARGKVRASFHGERGTAVRQALAAGLKPFEAAALKSLHGGS